MHVLLKQVLDVKKFQFLHNVDVDNLCLALAMLPGSDGLNTIFTRDDLERIQNEDTTTDKMFRMAEILKEKENFAFFWLCDTYLTARGHGDFAAELKSHKNVRKFHNLTNEEKTREGTEAAEYATYHSAKCNSCNQTIQMTKYQLPNHKRDIVVVAGVGEKEKICRVESEHAMNCFSVLTSDFLHEIHLDRRPISLAIHHCYKLHKSKFESRIGPISKITQKFLSKMTPESASSALNPLMQLTVGDGGFICWSDYFYRVTLSRKFYWTDAVLYIRSVLNTELDDIDEECISFSDEICGIEIVVSDKYAVCVTKSESSNEDRLTILASSSFQQDSPLYQANHGAIITWYLNKINFDILAMPRFTQLPIKSVELQNDENAPPNIQVLRAALEHERLRILVSKAHIVGAKVLLTITEVEISVSDLDDSKTEIIPIHCCRW